MSWALTSKEPAESVEAELAWSKYSSFPANHKYNEDELLQKNAFLAGVAWLSRQEQQPAADVQRKQKGK